MNSKVLLVIGVLAVILNWSISAFSSVKPMTESGRHDNTERRMENMFHEANEAYRKCLDKEARPNSSIRVAVIPSQTGTPDIGSYEPTRHQTLNCKGALDSQIEVIKTLQQH